MLNDVRSAFSDDPISHPTDDSPLDGYSRAVTAVVVIGRSASTVGRESRRNTLPRGGYKPASADRIA
jgi:hypothetical protein